MCKMCDEGTLHDHSGPQPGSRREFLKVTAATGAAVAGLPLFGARADGAQDDDDLSRARASRDAACSFGAAMSCRWIRGWAISSKRTCSSKARRS